MLFRSNRKIYRLSLRGNRRINHAIHMAAVTQIRHRHSDGRAYYDRKIAEGKTHKEALRCLKRRISDAVFARLQADARKAIATAAAKGPGGQPGNDSDSSAAGSHPELRLFGQATPGPDSTLRPATPAQAGHAAGTSLEGDPPLSLTTTAKRIRYRLRRTPRQRARPGAECHPAPAHRQASPIPRRSRAANLAQVTDDPTAGALIVISDPASAPAGSP